ncbi:unnamed protein product, partial [marine sediment metagenome]
MLPTHYNIDTLISQIDTWQTIPPFNARSLEDEVEAGDSWERSQDDWKSRLSINSSPLLVVDTARYLAPQHKRLRRLAAVTRFTTRNGIEVIRDIEHVKDIRRMRRKAYEDGDTLAMIEASELSYDFGHRISYKTVGLNCWCFTWVEANICEIAHDLGLPASTVGLIALMAGFAQSVDWIPLRHQ